MHDVQQEKSSQQQTSDCYGRSDGCSPRTISWGGCTLLAVAQISFMSALIQPLIDLTPAETHIGQCRRATYQWKVKP